MNYTITPFLPQGLVFLAYTVCLVRHLLPAWSDTFCQLAVSAGAVEMTEENIRTTCLWEARPDSSPGAGFRRHSHTLVSKVCSFYQLPYKRTERESFTTDHPATSHGGHWDQRLLWTAFLIVSLLCGKLFHEFWEVLLVGEDWTVSSLDLLRLGV